MSSDKWQQRLDKVMREKGFTMKSLSLSAGLGETFVRDALKRGRKPSIDNFQKLAVALGVSTDYLSGTFDIADARSDLSDERSFPSDARNSFVSLDRVSNRSLAPAVPGALPEIDLRASKNGENTRTLKINAGEEFISNHQIVQEWLLPESFLRSTLGTSSDRAFVMAVVGDSMVPTYRPGDRVIVDPSQSEFVSDAVYVISDGNSAPQIKRLQRVLFSDPAQVQVISDNEVLTANVVELKRVKIVGRVVGHIAQT
ncbi:LexA family transcriptional regulator [Chthonobacter rhizosphaerae]|uniref:LexA family transcriptional regulator n=1 Tax=Chthonobacter rhizosphaerae TaxID=2735553 RepID=UPI0015EF6202|nr:S24 family peptidase [Chthonobacter rhizosphaerae]